MGESLSNKIYDLLFSHMTRRSLRIECLLQLTITAMEIVQKEKGLTGESKKEIVIQTLKKAASSNLVTKSHRRMAKDMAEYILPKTIDLIVQSYKHEINLRKSKPISWCF